MRRLFLTALMACTVALLLLNTVPVAAGNGDSPQATNIELGKKILVRGPSPSKGKPSVTRGAATGALGATLPGNAQRYAIAIGISDYPGTANDLNYCDDDALLVEDVLLNTFHFDSVVTLTNLAASRDAIQSAIIDLAKTSKPSDEVVFFFSGHGARGNFPGDDAADAAQKVDTNGVDEAIVCHDGNENGSLQYIWDGELMAWFSAVHAARIVFIFDSCFAGGMTDLAGPDKVVCMACQETKLSAEGASWGGGHGQFAYYYFEEGIQQGWADRYDHDADGVYAGKRTPGEPGDVVVEEAFDYAFSSCGYQTPVISDLFADDLLL